jgi:hypothetical protein
VKFTIEKNKLEAIPVLVFMQVVIFSPPIFGKGLYFFVLFSLLSLIYLYKINQWGKIVRYYKEDLLLIGIMIFFCILWFIWERSSIFIIKLLLLIFSWILNPYALVIFCRRRNLNLLHLILFLGVLNALFSVISYAVPSFNNFVSTFLHHAEFDHPIRMYFRGIRGFGFSAGIFYQYSVFIGVITVFCLDNIIVGKKYYWLFILPVLLLTIIINARIGLVPVLLYIFYIAVIRFKFKRFLFLILLTLILYVLIINMASTRVSMMLEWTTSLFEEAYLYFVKGETSDSYFVRLFETFLVFPDTNFEWIFGKGIHIFVQGDQRSDLGYIIQLNYGGLIFLFLVLLFFINVYVKLKKAINKNDTLKNYHFFPFIFLGTALISNYKGDFLSANVGLPFFACFYVYFYVNSFLDNRFLEE